MSTPMAFPDTNYVRVDVLIIATALVLSAVLFLYNRQSSSLPLPPGPEPLPVLGNLFQMPKSHNWLTFHKWGEKYGDVVYVSVLGKPFLILNSLKAMSDLFEKKGATAHHRPNVVMINDLIGLEKGPSFTSDMELHKKYRTLFAHALNSRASQQYWPIQQLESRKMVIRLLDSPERFNAHIKRTIVSVIFLVTYGYQIESDADPFACLAEDTIVHFTQATGPPPRYLVDYLPILRYIPAWFPGAKFQTVAANSRAEWMDLLQKPFELVKANRAAGTALPSFTSNLLEQGGADEVGEEDNIRWSAGMMYLAGSDTSWATIHTFYLLMLHHPEVQSKAQAELDEVVGWDRMPTYEDKDRLVFCSAVTKEVLRWHPVAPLGVPHALSQDEEYRGYRLPKGSMILPNLWSILRDPVTYPSPEIFMPERFLSADGMTLENPEGARDFSSAVFSIGRRSCPGSFLAEASVWIAVVNTLWTFNISKPVGSTVMPLSERESFASGLVSHPKPFLCDIRPRSPQHAEIARQTVAE